MRFRTHQEKANASTLQLLALFAVLVLAIVLLVNGALAIVYRLMFAAAQGFPEYFFATNTGLVLLFVVGGVAVESLRVAEGGEHVAKMAGARPAQVSSSSDLGRLERRFANIVCEMAIASRLKKPPAAWVLHRDDAINAFAAGWHEEDHVVVVTRGALERLTREELQGVVAHEFAHLRHGDTTLFMRVIGMVWGLQMVHGFGRALADPDEQGAVPISAIFGYAFMGVGWLGWVGGRLLQAAVSRQREFNADASAVEYTRLTAGLGGALRKIAMQATRATEGRRGDRDADVLRTPGADSVSHLLLHHRSAWLATHPPLHERLERLFGRVVDPLPDEVLPVGQDEALLSFASNRSRSHASAPQADDQAHPSADKTSDAEQHDVLQPAAAKAQAADAREALMRIERWHGPLERRAALLALLLDRGDSAAWQRWEAQVNHPATSKRVRADLQALDAPARLRVFASLIERSRAAPREELALLRREARLLDASPAARLRRLVMLRLLDKRALPAHHRSRSLAQCLPSAVVATAALARVAAPQNAAPWLGAARKHLEAVHVALPPLPYWHMRQVLRIAPMERPRLMAAWMQATRTAGLMQDEAAREALALAAIAMDTPVALG